MGQHWRGRSIRDGDATFNAQTHKVLALIAIGGLTAIIVVHYAIGG